MKHIQTSEQGEEADRLGRLAEGAFEYLCNQASLICNRFVVDRTGKDFYVERPLEKINSLISYDKRLEADKFLFQIKATTNSKRSVSISLSNADRMTKESGPTCICVVIYNALSDDKPIGIRFIEFIDTTLERILRRLRQETKKQNPDLHRSKISLPISKLTTHKVDKEALLAYLATLAKPTMESYQHRKREQLKNAGYKSHRYSMNISVEMSGEHLAEQFLGLTEVNGLVDRAEEIRFGIALPTAEHFRVGDQIQLRFTPEPSEEGVVEICRRGKVEETVRVEAYHLPTGGLGDFALRWRMGRLVTDQKSRMINVTLGPILGETTEVQAYLESIRFMSCLTQGTCDLYYRGPNGRLRLGDMKIADDGDLNLQKIWNVLEPYEAIFRRAGYPERTSLEAAWATRQNASTLNAMMTRSVKIVTSSDMVEVPDIDNTNGEHIAAVEMAGSWFGVILPLLISNKTEGSTQMWTGYRNGEVIIELLHNNSAEVFEAFVGRFTKFRQSKITFVQRPEQFDLVEIRTG